MLLAYALPVAYTFLPYGSTPAPRGENSANAGLLVSPHQRETILNRLTEDGGHLVAERELDSANSLLLVNSNHRPEDLEAQYFLPLDAGPFDSLEEAAALCRRWLLEYWACHKIGEDQNSCFEFGACHRRCWWRGSIGTLALQMDTVGVQQQQQQQVEAAEQASALTYLLDRAATDSGDGAAADGEAEDSKKILALRGCLVSFGTGMHYAGLRPDTSSPRARPVRMALGCSNSGSSGSSRCKSSSSSSAALARSPPAVMSGSSGESFSKPRQSR